MYRTSEIPVSIEKFAAYLDGNLSSEEMQQMSSLIDSDSGLQEIVNSSNMVDETLSNFSMDGTDLPEEISSDDFFIPLIGNEDIFSSPYEDVACAACADSSIDDVIDIPNSEEYVSSGDDTTMNIHSSVDDVSGMEDLNDNVLPDTNDY